MNTPARFVLSVLMIGLAAACSVPGSPVPAPVANIDARPALSPGDTVSGMALTTGSVSATSIWQVCRPDPSLTERAQIDCRVSAGPLAIGPSASVLLEHVNPAEWDLLEWSLLLDGQ